MRHSKLLVTTALALLAGTGIALSQDRSAPAQGGPAMQQQAPGQEKGKAGNAQREGQAQQPGRAQNQRGKNAETTGQAPPANQGQSERSQRGEESPAPKAQQGQQPKQGAGQQNRNDTTTGQQQPKQDQAPAARSQGQQQPQTQPQQQGQTNQQRPGAAPETRGQGAAGVTFTTEQRTRIRETVLRGGSAPRVERASINFALTVGTVVPRTVRLVAVPELIVEVHPAWRGYLYFVVDDEIIIVEPGSLRIVAVIAV